ncbi:MAG: altronate dehydratase family protein, partial [Muribaculaceae bacterium]|nr:altronate dehydratase family protein [Muribaculaceae bacterium]
MKRYIRINQADSVVVALHDGGLPKGTVVEIDGTRIIVADNVPRGHKLAVRHVEIGEKVIKYGYPIGVATRDIAPGEWVHTHNLSTALGADENYSYNPSMPAVPVADDTVTVDGYLRADGRMGIRNELWIVPTVGCVNGQANAIVRRLQAECDLHGIDDVRAFTHNYGCSQLGADHANTRAALAALALHPNAGGVLVLGLGCENNRIDEMQRVMSGYDAERVRFLTAQNVEDEVEEGVRLCKELIKRMRLDVRRPLPLSLLKVGLKCGGSDGLSGITANPLVGMFSDWLVRHGGTTVLTEVPEMFGAETT